MTTKYQKAQKRHEIEEQKRKNAIKWDKKSSIVLSLIILFVVLCLININVDLKGYFVKNNINWASTCAKIKSIEALRGMEQTKVGNRFVTNAYIVTYSYEVDNKMYEDSIWLNSRSIKCTMFIHQIYEGDFCQVFYKKVNPEESHLITEVESGCYNKKGK